MKIWRVSVDIPAEKVSAVQAEQIVEGIEDLMIDVREEKDWDVTSAAVEIGDE